MMTDEWRENDDLLTAATNCPMADCGEVALAYRPVESDDGSKHGIWEFTCPRCGLDFLALEEDLLFRSAPKEWFWTGIHSA